MPRTNEWERIETVACEGTVLLTVFDGQEIVSIELLDTEDMLIAESCASALGFGTLSESV